MFPNDDGPKLLESDVIRLKINQMAKWLRGELGVPKNAYPILSPKVRMVVRIM